MFTVPYEHAVLLQTIPSQYHNMLCSAATCETCPARAEVSSMDHCQFVLYYKTDYSILASSLREAAREKYPPETYPELYI